MQVAGQQGAYIARTINRNHVHGIGGGDPPFMTVEGNKAEQPEHTFDFLVRLPGIECSVFLYCPFASSG